MNKQSNLYPSFNNKILILIPTYQHLRILKVFFSSLVNLLDTDSNILAVCLDNNSDLPIKKFLSSLSHPQLFVELLPENIGKGNGLNQFIEKNLNSTNLPKVIVSLDSDIIFSPESFHYLIKAVCQIPNAGIIGMKYEKNQCNPERNLFFPAKKIRGENNEIFSINIPFLCNVAGGIIAIKGTILENQLNFELYPRAKGRVCYPDDGWLHDKLKPYKFINGYLNGAYASHLKSAKGIYLV